MPAARDSVLFNSSQSRTLYIPQGIRLKGCPRICHSDLESWPSETSHGTDTVIETDKCLLGKGEHVTTLVSAGCCSHIYAELVQPSPSQVQCPKSLGHSPRTSQCNAERSIDNYVGIALADNDPSAGSPTETLLRLLLPLRKYHRVYFQIK